MRSLAQLICLIGPLFPAYMLLRKGAWDNPLTIGLGLVFLLLHLLPFIYLWRFLPPSDSPLRQQGYWLAATVLVALLGNGIYWEFYLASSAPDYRPDAQEALVFFVIPFYQGIAVFGFWHLWRLLARFLGGSR